MPELPEEVTPSCCVVQAEVATGVVVVCASDVVVEVLGGATTEPQAARETVATTRLAAATNLRMSFSSVQL